MTDKNDQGLAESAFSEDEDFAAPPEGGGEFRETLEPAGGKAKKASSTRLLLLVLLLVVAAAGAWFVLNGSPPAEEPVVAVQVKKQPIAIPPPPPVVAEEAPAKPAQVAEPQKTPVAPAPAEKAPAAAATEPKSPAPAAAVTATEAPATPAPAKEAAASTAAAGGRYTIDAGAFLLKSNRLEAERILRNLGYAPQVATIQRPVEMVRLQVASVTPGEAEAKLQEIRQVAPGAFSMRKGDGVAIYAGSYVNLDQARAFADRLFLQGIEIVEEKSQVPMTLSRVTFGSFADVSAARQAAARVEAAGLQATVTER